MSKVLLGHKPGRVAKKQIIRWRKLKGSWWVNLLWEPRDLWIGVYWKQRDGTGWSRAVDVYITLIPMLPIRIMWRKMEPIPGAGVLGGR